MDWDKNFTENNLSDASHSGISKDPSYMSESEEAHMENIALVRCGKILWRSIIYGLYMFLVILVVQTQIQSSKQYQINSELGDFIRNEKLSTLVIDPRNQEREEFAA